MIRPDSIRKIALALLVSLVAACGGKVFRQPEVALQGIQLGGIGLTGGTLLVDLRVHNPNGFTLKAERLRYDLHLGDRAARAAGDSTWVPFAQGTYDREFRVGGGDTETIQIPVEFSYSALGGAAASIFRRGTFEYRATGEVEVDTPLGDRSVPFRKSGTVTVAGVR